MKHINVLQKQSSHRKKEDLTVQLGFIVWLPDSENTNKPSAFPYRATTRTPAWGAVGRFVKRENYLSPFVILFLPRILNILKLFS